MARQWQFNPPPNWPLAPGEPPLDWRPDPQWGPPPVGWELWHRRRTASLRRRTLAVVSAVAGLGAVAVVQLAQGSAIHPEPLVQQSGSLHITLVTEPVPTSPLLRRGPEVTFALPALPGRLHLP